MLDIFTQTMKDLDAVMEAAQTVIDNRTGVWEAKVGWEIADGEFQWDMKKSFDNRFDAQQWVDTLVKTGNFDSGEVKKKIKISAE